LNGRERGEWYPKVVEKQHGEFCNGCGKSLLGKWNCTILYIDHIDNNSNHTVIENLQLLCPSCNRIKNPKKIEVVPDRPYTPEMAKNTKYEGPWRNWISKTVLKDGGILFVNAVDGGAEKFGLSPETTRKWVRKLISDEGNYGMFQDSVVFKKDIPILEEEASKKEDLQDKYKKDLNQYTHE